MAKTPYFLIFSLVASTLASEPMNILFIAVDDLVPRLGVYGDTVAQSPRIDALAALGTTFLHAQTQYPVCGPSRASLMSGLRPESVGVLDLETPWRDASPSLISLPQYLKDSHGYFTTGTGKILDYRNVADPNTMDEESWSEPFDPSPGTSPDDVERKGRTTVTAPYVNHVTAAPEDPLDNFPDYRIAQDGIDRLRERAAADEPFFLAVGFKKPHLPFFAPDEYWALYNRDDFTIHPFQMRAADNSGYGYGNSYEIRNYEPIPSDPNIVPASDFSEDLQKELIHGYYACVSYIDALVGMLLDELEALNLQDDTIIVLWGDHGFHLGDLGQWAKNTPFEQAARVPLIIVDPTRSNQVATTTAPAELTDIYPTLCELVGVPLPDFLEGKSLLPALDDPAAKPREGAVTVHHIPDKIGYSIRNERYRYIEWISEIDKTVVGRDLFDYETDPYEQQNLIDDPAYVATMEMMTDMLHNDTAGLLLLQESLSPRLIHNVPDEVPWGYKAALGVNVDPKEEVVTSNAVYLNDELKHSGTDTAITLNSFYAYLPAQSSNTMRVEVDFASGAQLDEEVSFQVGVGDTTIEKWDFSGTNPETGSNGTTVSTWTTNAPNSVPSAGVLRYAATSDDDSNWGDAQLLSDIDTSAIDQMIWTIECADLKVSAGSNFRFSTVTSAGGDVRPELELTSYGAGPDYTFSPDMEYHGGTDDLGGSNIALTGSQLGGPLTIVATWDFVNNTMTLQVGNNAPVSITPTANMAATIGTITGFRVYPDNITAGDYLDLDSVTIETTTRGLGETFAQWKAKHDWGSVPDQDANVDPNDNGLVNLLDYAMGYDPVTKGGMNEGLAIYVEEYENESHAFLTYRRNKLASDVSLQVMISHDLSAWDLVPPSDWKLSKEDIDGGNAERVTLRHALYPSFDKAFLKVSAEINP